MNMLETIVPKSDQLNADDLIGRTMTITVTEVRIKLNDEQPVHIHYEGGDGKPYKACKSMRRVLVHVWGPDAKQYAGRSMTLYRDPDIMFGPGKVGGIRISHMSHIAEPKTMALTEKRGSRKPFTVRPLVVEAGKAPEQTDRVGDGVRALITRIRSAEPGSLDSIINDPDVVKQRAWLTANRPNLATLVDEAIAECLPSADDDPFSNPFADQPSDQVSPPPAAAEPPSTSAGPSEAADNQDEQHPAVPAANDLINRIKASTEAEAFEKIVNGAQLTIESMPADIAETVNGVIERKRRTFAVPAK